MAMLLITKELAKAVVRHHVTVRDRIVYCMHCRGEHYSESRIQHTPECIVVRAKLLLEIEWGIKS